MLALAFVLALAATSDSVSCSATTGAPPIRLAHPTTRALTCTGGEELTWEQEGLTRYACLNLPSKPRGDRRWPMIVYLHGSLTTPDNLYKSGRHLVDLHDTYRLADDVEGFILLAPEGRRAHAWPSAGGTGTGFHWDEWYRDADKNLDALAIDHFIDVVVARGIVDPKRIYVYGWSNGAYMAALYANWRSDRIAAAAQYAGANPWSRQPCPVTPQYTRKVPLFLMRNLCDYFVTCDDTNDWISFLQKQNWPFRYVSLTLAGGNKGTTTTCFKRCPSVEGLTEHIRWPREAVLLEMLEFLKANPMP